MNSLIDLQIVSTKVKEGKTQLRNHSTIPPCLSCLIQIIHLVVPLPLSRLLPPSLRLRLRPTPHLPTQTNNKRPRPQPPRPPIPRAAGLPGQQHYQTSGIKIGFGFHNNHHRVRIRVDNTFLKQVSIHIQWGEIHPVQLSRKRGHESCMIS